MSQAMLVAARPSLVELAETARREDDLALGAARDAVAHAIAAGQALLDARDQLSHGDWHKWLGENWDRSLNRAQSYMRVARHRALVEADQPPTIRAAMQMLVGTTDNRIDPLMKAEAQRLRDAGRTWDEIASELGRSVSAIRRYIDPRAAGHAARSAAKRSKAAQREARQEERSAQVNRAGNPRISHVYSLVRKSQDVLREAADEERNTQSRQLIRSALSSLVNVEDKLVAATEAVTA